MSSPTVRDATGADQGAVVDVITLAFAADPMARWSLPNPDSYLKAMPDLVRAFGARAFDCGGAHCLLDHGGAALWLAPGIEPDGERLVGLIEEHAPAERMADLMTVFEQMDGYHPKEPHWYLPLIGVDPVRHGQGLGSALIRHALARSDREGLPAYLESSNPRNISLYERLGFERLGVIQVGSSPTLVPMLRPPRQAGRP